MASNDTPKDGDFTSYIEQRAKSTASNAASPMAAQAALKPDDASTTRRPQSINDVLVNGEEPDEEFLDAFIALENAPTLSDDDLEQQALAHPGADGDAQTPE